MIPLDITERFRWSTSNLDDLRTAGRLGGLLAEGIDFVLDRDGVFVPHDAVSAVALAAPELFTWTTRSARCETLGLHTTGETVVDRRPGAAPGSVSVAEDVDVAEVSARIVDAVRNAPRDG